MIKVNEIQMEHHCIRYIYEVSIDYCGYTLCCKFTDNTEAKEIEELAKKLVEYDWVKAKENMEFITGKMWTLIKNY